MTDDSLKIAVIGMAGRFPGAENIDQFWHNLQTGTTGGVQLSSVKDGLVHYGFPLPDADKFDADFFRYLFSRSEDVGSATSSILRILLCST